MLLDGRRVLSHLMLVLFIFDETAIGMREAAVRKCDLIARRPGNVTILAVPVPLIPPLQRIPAGGLDSGPAIVTLLRN